MLALLVQPASRGMTNPLCIVQFLKIECSMLIMPLSRWFIANLRPLVTSFRVNMWLHFDNKPSDIQVICNFKHLFISRFISEYYIRQRVCPFNNIVLKKPFPATINHSTHEKQDIKFQQL